MIRALLAALVVLLADMAAAQNPQPDPYPNCRGWIPHECCCTQRCCFEIDESEIRQQPNGKYLILATGQEIEAKLSRDGTFTRCACDQVGGAGWVAHPLAKTHCLFLPLLG